MGAKAIVRLARRRTRTTREAGHSADKAGLSYGTDRQPGIHRVGPKRFLNARGRVVRDRATLERIRSLVIPPAWTDVWISPQANSHLQATGRDARGRKQYRYHPSWREVREANKYDRVIAFAKALPRLRRRVQRDLRRRGLPKVKVLAAIVQLLEASLIRIGNDEYAKSNRSFGLTTLHNRHAEVHGATVRFRFRGKSGVSRDVELKSPRVARIVRHCQDLPGQELFAYLDDEGQACDVGSADVNDYLREITSLDVSTKDFRTWAGTSLAAQALREFEAFDTQARCKRNVVRAIERVAKRLGNTPSVCRKCYVHPAVIESYMDRSLADSLRRRSEKELRGGVASLSSEEAAVLALLQQRLKRKHTSSRTTKRKQVA